jgi:hypothetical protein
MGGRGRSYKDEDVYLRACESPNELEAGAAKWVAHYNQSRHHQALLLPHFRVNNATRRLINLRSDFFDSLENIGRSQVW